MDHFRTGIGLLAAGRECHRVELADRVVALEDDARIFPGDRRTGLDLGPGDLRAITFADAALCDEVEDPALAGFLVAGVPVLHRRILDLGVLEGHQFNHRCVQLVLIPHWRGATLEVADIRTLVGHDQGAFELAGVGGVDAEVGRQLHRASHPFGDVDE